MMRLCVLTQYHAIAPTGGAEYQIERLLDTLVGTHKYDIDYLAHFIVPGTPHGYRVVRIGRGRQVSRFGFWLDAVPLYRALREIRPDVIYQRIACGYTGVAAYYAVRNGARLIWHVSSDTDVTPHRSALYGRNVIQSFVEKQCIEYGIRHANSIVVQTEHQADELARHYGRKADAVVPNFHPEPSEAIDKSDPPSVVWVANLKPLKRPEVFVRLAARLRDLTGVRFIIVGAMQGGPKAWREQLLHDIQVAPNLDYVGPKTQREVNDLLARAHVLVNTSVAEGYPNTFIQAWQREVPVVSLTINPDGVLDRQAVGICAGSEQRLEEAVRSLLEDSTLRNEYGVRAREYAARRHSLLNTRALVRLIDTGEVDPENVPNGSVENAIADLRIDP
jgi:glycosyltransferase involved in cell wall biosynthesis